MHLPPGNVQETGAELEDHHQIANTRDKTAEPNTEGRKLLTPRRRSSSLPLSRNSHELITSVPTARHQLNIPHEDLQARKLRTRKVIFAEQLPNTSRADTSPLRGRLLHGTKEQKHSKLTTLLKMLRQTETPHVATPEKSTISSSNKQSTQRKTNKVNSIGRDDSSKKSYHGKAFGFVNNLLQFIPSEEAVKNLYNFDIMQISPHLKSLDIINKKVPSGSFFLFYFTTIITEIGYSHPSLADTQQINRLLIT